MELEGSFKNKTIIKAIDPGEMFLLGVNLLRSHTEDSTPAMGLLRVDGCTAALRR